MRDGLRGAAGRISSGGELALVVVLAWAALLAFTVSAGGMRLSWDALNHHVYLGWVADRPRFDKDFLAAGYQSLQFPYLYWPLYKLAIGGYSAVVAGVVLATLHLLAVPAVWMIARVCVPGTDWGAVFMRGLAVGLAFLTGAVLSLFDASSNDLLAAIPLIWSIALALRAATPQAPMRDPLWLVLLSGLLAGASVACKFSNGPIAVLMPLLWAFAAAPGWPKRVRNVAIGCLAAGAGALVVYGYWGWQLWQHFGNPIYPFADGLFAPVRAYLGWTG